MTPGATKPRPARACTHALAARTVVAALAPDLSGSARALERAKASPDPALSCIGLTSASMVRQGAADGGIAGSSLTMTLSPTKLPIAQVAVIVASEPDTGLDPAMPEQARAAGVGWNGRT